MTPKPTTVTEHDDITYNRHISDVFYNLPLMLSKVYRKVHEEPKAEAAANPRHQEEDKSDTGLACA